MCMLARPGMALFPTSFVWLLAGFSFSQAVGQRASVPCLLLAEGCPQFPAKWTSLCRGRLTPCQLPSSVQTSQRARESSSKTETSVFCNLILEVISHHFCHILFVRKESLGPAHTQGEEIPQRCEYQEVGFVTATLEGCLLQMSSIKIGIYF